MSGELAERIARVIAGTRGHDWAALDGSYGGRVVRVQIMREVDAILPIINAEIAAERERCAGVVDAEVAKFAKSALPTMPKLKAALMEYFSIIAAAIRSQP